MSDSSSDSTIDFSNKKQLTFKPLYLSSCWVERETTKKRITVAIVLPSGVGTGNFSLRILENGMSIELKVVWPNPLANLNIMYRKWPSDPTDPIKKYHPKMIEFESSLNELRDRSSEFIESYARIPLPFCVQTHIERKNHLAWRDSAVKMVYLYLKATMEDYVVLHDNEEFEIS